MKRFGSVLWGIVLIIIGLILAVNATGMIHINLFFHGWWTLFLIVPCAIGLIAEREKTWNMIGLLLGIALLLCAQGIIRFDLIIKLAFPAILVIIGLSIIFKDAIEGGITKKIKELNKDGLEEYCATFSGQKVNITGEFKGANIDSIFGSVELDLLGSEITSDKVVHASTIFGGAQIYVPRNVNVKIKSTSIFGGVDNKYDRQYTEGLPTVYVDAFCLFGGVEIK